jgi:outer membrane protein TolC
MKILLTIIAGGFLIPLCARAEALTRHDIVSILLRDNPRVQAARAKWEMMKKRVPQVRAWDDPMAGVDVERMGTTRFDTFTDNEWMLSQSVPVTGKNLVRGRIANSEALAAFEEFRRATLDAVSRARAAYARLAGAYGRLEITHRNEEVLKEFAEITRVKYEAGIQTQSDLLIAQTDLARVAETQAQIEREISEQQTELNVLMNRPASAALGRLDGLTFTTLTLSRQAIESQAIANRPEIIFSAHAVEAEKSRRDLARRQWIPDPQLRVEARQFNGSNGIQEYDTGVFFSLPWPNYFKYSAGVAEAGKGLERARKEHEAARAEVLGMVRDQLKKIDISARNYQLFNDKLVPLANQALQSSRSSYESDRTSFLELLTARRTLQDVESGALQHLVDHEVAIAELDAIIGRQIEETNQK